MAVELGGGLEWGSVAGMGMGMGMGATLGMDNLSMDDNLRPRSTSSSSHQPSIQVPASSSHSNIAKHLLLSPIPTSLGPGTPPTASPLAPPQILDGDPNPSSQASENEKVYWLIVDLMNTSTREAALLELSKKREQWDDLALVLWHSFGRSHSLAIESLLCR